MKTPTDVMDLVRIICDFYNSYRETLGMSHEVARHKVELMYDDLHDWLYPEDEICIGDDPELRDIYVESVGHISEQTIRKYVEEQKNK